MAVLAVGADLAGLQRLFAPRQAALGEQYTQPMDTLARRVEAAERTLTQLQQQRTADSGARWQRYRVEYERLLQDDLDDAEEAPISAPQPRVWNPEKPVVTNEAPRVGMISDVAGRLDAPVAASAEGD